MQRTPVIVAFFLAAALVGMFLRFTDMSGGVETFKLPSDKMSPIDVSDAPGISPYNGTSPILGSQAKPVPELPSLLGLAPASAAASHQHAGAQLQP